MYWFLHLIAAHPIAAHLLFKTNPVTKKVVVDVDDDDDVDGDDGDDNDDDGDDEFQGERNHC